MHDLRFAIRQLLKNPGFTAVAVLTLALGIGANTAIFSVVNTVLLKPLPYPDSERLVMVCENNLKQGWKQNVVSPGNFLDWQEQSTVFEKLAGVRFDNFNLSGVENPQRLMAAQITSNYFEVFGARPLIGRTFLPEEYGLQGPRTVVLSEGLWRRQFGAETNVIGRPVMLNGLTHTVVGVMPSSFQFFHPTTVNGWPDGLRDAEVWRPFYLNQEQSRERNNHWWLVLGRLKNGVSLARAQSEMDTISRRIHEAHPDYSDWGISVAPFHAQAVAHVRPALMALLAGVACVLLIVCANLGNLFLTRAITRQKEFAIRMALGAGRAPVLRQLIVESCLIALLGGAGGLLVARWGMSGLLALSPADLPRASEVGWGLRVLGVTLLVSAFTGLVFGLAPALGIFRIDLNRSLAQSGRSGTGTIQRSRLRNALVVSQVALALMLLVTAGLLGRSLWKVLQVDPGFKPDHLLVADISLVDRKYTEMKSQIEFARRLVERVEALPGVESAATVYGLPLGSMLYGQFALEIEGRPPLPGQLDVAHVRHVSPRYFETMRMPLLWGRTFSESDKVDSPAVVIINEAMAAKYFPGEDPLGKRISLGDGLRQGKIIGLVGDAKPLGLDQQTPPEVYRSHTQTLDWYLSLVVRTSAPREAMLAAIRREIRSIDADRALYNVRSMDQALAASLAARRFAMTLIGVFALVALALSGLGIYGVVSCSVGQQTREIGVRVALGAQRADVIRLVITQGLLMAFFGLSIGLAGTLVITRLVASQLFQIRALDPLTLTTMASMLLLSALFASWLPARRAAKVDPMEALRYE